MTSHALQTLCTCTGPETPTLEIIFCHMFCQHLTPCGATRVAPNHYTMRGGWWVIVEEWWVLYGALYNQTWIYFTNSTPHDHMTNLKGKDIAKICPSVVGNFINICVNRRSLVDFLLERFLLRVAVRGEGEHLMARCEGSWWWKCESEKVWKCESVKMWKCERLLVVKGKL